MNERLKNIAMAALVCPHDCGMCAGKRSAFNPAEGHMPRGFGGGTGDLSAIKLVIATAEPGNPKRDESYSGSPEKMLVQIEATFERLMNEKKNRFHRNLNALLAKCWPDEKNEERWRRTWFTNLVLCSAIKSCGPVHRDVENTCARTYFAEQMRLLPHAFVIVLGGKAEERCERLHLRNRIQRADHPSRWIGSPLPSFEAAANEFRAWLGSSSSTSIVGSG